MRAVNIVRVSVVLFITIAGFFLWNDFNRKKLDRGCWKLAVAHTYMNDGKIAEERLHKVVGDGLKGMNVDIYKECKRVSGLIE